MNNNEKRGFFLAIEGIDGVGKTELSRHLFNILNKDNPQRIYLTYEPCDSCCSGLFIRQVLGKKIRCDDYTLALAFAANRNDHVNRIILPFLRNYPDGLIISDRYYLSSLVYQTTNEISMDKIMQLNSGAINPDLLIFLNAKSNTLYNRISKRNAKRELFENNLNKKRHQYYDAINFISNRGILVKEVSADDSIELVISRIIETLEIYGPKYINYPTQLPLLLENPSHEKIRDIPKDEKSFKFISQLFSSYHNQIFLNDNKNMDIKDDLFPILKRMRSSQVIDLFIELMYRNGFKIISQRNWRHNSLIILEYTIPTQITFRGCFFALDRAFNYSQISSFINLYYEKDNNFGQLDFFICFDPSESDISDISYTQDLINVPKRISPQISIVNRKSIAIMLNELEF